jgi:ABC-type transporter Mla MlaB component|nr:MAG TPA: hypothetical protein [Caudoviricetes sp.]
MKIKKFIRAKTIHCGTTGYKEIDIVPRTSLQDSSVKGKRKRIRESAPKQKNLNDKNSKRYLIQLCNGNFTEDDYHVSATYKDKFLPQTQEDGEKEVNNFLTRIKRRLKREGLGELKYVLVTECNFSKDNDKKPVRIHHHIIISCELDRDTIEDLWSRRKKKGEKKGERLGTINVDRLQFDQNGIEGLCEYITKAKKSKKRWSSSRNLVRPYSRKNDSKFGKREVERLCKSNDPISELEKKYPKLNIVEVQTKYYEEDGWHIYIKGWVKRE